MKVKELIEKLKGYEEYEIGFTVHKLLTDEELKNFKYKYPYKNIESDLEIDDIYHSRKIVNLSCEI